MDFLSCPKELKGFDVCIDKGTFDAISLNPVNTNEGKRQYVQALKDVLKDNGFFAITSCNWTKEQLLDRFSEGEKKFITVWSALSYHGWGLVLNVTSVLCWRKFQRRDDEDLNALKICTCSLAILLLNADINASQMAATHVNMIQMSCLYLTEKKNGEERWF